MFGKRRRNGEGRWEDEEGIENQWDLDGKRITFCQRVSESCHGTRKEICTQILLD